MVNGYVDNGVLAVSSDASPCINIQSNKWNFLKIMVKEECNNCTNVDGFINGCKLFSFQSHFNTRGFGGVLAENGFSNVVEFRKFDIDPIIPEQCPGKLFCFGILSSSTPIKFRKYYFNQLNSVD